MRWPSATSVRSAIAPKRRDRGVDVDASAVRETADGVAADDGRGRRGSGVEGARGDREIQVVDPGRRDLHDDLAVARSRFGELAVPGVPCSCKTAAFLAPTIAPGAARAA
jgi:hypothetical protein